MELKTNKALCAVLEGCAPFQRVCEGHTRANLYHRVLYVLEQVKKTGTADYMAVNDFLCKEWSTVCSILKQKNVITVEDGKFHFKKDKYMVNPKYKKRDCTVEIKDSIVSKWQSRQKQSKRVSIKKHTQRMYQSDSILEGVKLWNDAFLSIKVNPEKRDSIFSQLKLDTETEAQQRALLEQIERGECYFPTLNKGRLYTPFHSLKKELRGCLTLDGEPLKEMCDAKAAFQTASASVFLSLFPDFKEEAQAFIRQMDKGIRGHFAKKRKIPNAHVKSVFMFLWFASMSERKRALDCDYDLLYKITNIKNTGGIRPVSLPPPSSNKVGDNDKKYLTEDEIIKVGDLTPFQEWCAKVGVSLSTNAKKHLTPLYGEGRLKRPANDVLRYVGIGAEIDSIFKKHCPAFWYWVRGYSHSFRSGQMKSNLPVDLMQCEGDGVFRLIMPAIASFFRRGVLTLHDALFCAESEANAITDDMFNYLYRDAVAFQAEKAYYLEKFSADKGTAFYDGVLKMIENREKQKIADYRRYVADFIHKRKNAA